MYVIAARRMSSRGSVYVITTVYFVGQIIFAFLLFFNTNCGKLIVPNQLNIMYKGRLFRFRDNYALLGIHSFCEFDKNANSINLSVLIALYIELVWRLSEFAFFVRLLR